MIFPDEEMDLSYLKVRRLTEDEVRRATKVFVENADEGMELCFGRFPNDYVWLDGVIDYERAERIEEGWEKEGIPWKRMWEKEGD